MHMWVHTHRCSQLCKRARIRHHLLSSITLCFFPLDTESVSKPRVRQATTKFQQPTYLSTHRYKSMHRHHTHTHIPDFVHGFWRFELRSFCSYTLSHLPSQKEFILVLELRGNQPSWPERLDGVHCGRITPLGFLAVDQEAEGEINHQLDLAEPMSPHPTSSI